jgi:hypothetical protein
LQKAQQQQAPRFFALIFPICRAVSLQHIKPEKSNDTNHDDDAEIDSFIYLPGILI